MQKKLFISIFLLIGVILWIVKWQRDLYDQSYFQVTEFFSLQEIAHLGQVKSYTDDHKVMQSGFFLFKMMSDHEQFLSQHPIIPDFYVQEGKIKSRALFYTAGDIVELELRRWNSVKNLQQIENDYMFYAQQTPRWIRHGKMLWDTFLPFLFYGDFFTFIQQAKLSFWDFLALRERLIPLHGKILYQIVQWGNRRFLVFTTSTTHTMLYWLSLDQREFPLYRFVGKLSKIKQVIINILQNPEWFYSQEQVPFPDTIDDFTPFTILDFFTFKHLHAEHRQLLEEFTIRYFHNLLGQAQHDNYLHKYIITALQKLLILHSLRDEQGNHFYSTKFKDNILLMLQQHKDVHSE